MECERHLDLKTVEVSIIVFWIMIWGFGDEVKVACFLVFGANKQLLSPFLAPEWC